MIRHENENGSINVSTNVYTDIVGTAAANCFGVKGMAARSVTDGVYHLYDYQFFYRNLQENVEVRLNAYLEKQEK